MLQKYVLGLANINIQCFCIGIIHVKKQENSRRKANNDRTMVNKLRGIINGDPGFRMQD